MSSLQELMSLMYQLKGNKLQAADAARQQESFNSANSAYQGQLSNWQAMQNARLAADERYIEQQIGFAGPNITPEQRAILEQQYRSQLAEPGFVYGGRPDPPGVQPVLSYTQTAGQYVPNIALMQRRTSLQDMMDQFDPKKKVTSGYNQGRPFGPPTPSGG